MMRFIFLLLLLFYAVESTSASAKLKDILIKKNDANTYLGTPTQRRLGEGLWWGQDCGPGLWFEDEFWNDECHECSTGKYQDSGRHRHSSCKNCPSGQYQNQNRQGGCKHCGLGQYQNSNAQSGCKGCPAGQYQNQNVQTSCKACDTGQYQDQTSKNSCVSCFLNCIIICYSTWFDTNPLKKFFKQQFCAYRNSAQQDSSKIKLKRLIAFLAPREHTRI